jgi:hypothetical protein
MYHLMAYLLPKVHPLPTDLTAARPPPAETRLASLDPAIFQSLAVIEGRIWPGHDGNCITQDAGLCGPRPGPQSPKIVSMATISFRQFSPEHRSRKKSVNLL